MKLTNTEAQGLAERLFARSTSKLSTASAEEKRDLEIAARVLWLLLEDLNPGHVIELSEER